MHYSKLLLGMLLFWILSIHSQNIPQDYYSIRHKYEFRKKNDSSVLPDVMQFISLAKKNKDQERLVQAYKDAVLFNPSEIIKLKYADSTIMAALKTDNNELITSAFLGKGIIYYFNFRKYKLALNEYLTAYDYAREIKNKYLQHKVIYHIGVVKSYLGYYKEAEEHFLTCARYYKKQLDIDGHPNQIYNDKKGYFNSLHQLIISYRYQKNYSKSDSLIALGLMLTADHNDFELENAYLNKCKAIRDYHFNNHASSLQTLQKALPYIKNSGDFAWSSVIYHYMAKNYLKMGALDKVLIYFQKVDSIFNKHQFILPELRPNYEYLINYFKHKKNINQELYYTNQLLRADSLITQDFSYLSGKIHKEYDTKMLKQEKERLEHANVKKVIYAIAISVIAVVLGLLFLLYYKKEKNLTVKYELLQKKLSGLDSENQTNVLKVIDKKSVLSKEINQELEIKINYFEETRGFVAKGLSLSKLATKFKTNTYYLSTYINETKGMNFNRYLTRLRIDFITQKMNTDKKFLNYNIEALAAECGISSRQHFSDLFFDINGIRPKDFIRKRKQELEN